MANLARGHASRKIRWPGATRRDRIGKLKRCQTPVTYGAVLSDARSVLRLATMTMLGGRRGRHRRFWTQHDPAIVGVDRSTRSQASHPPDPPAQRPSGPSLPERLNDQSQLLSPVSGRVALGGDRSLRPRGVDERDLRREEVAELG